MSLKRGFEATVSIDDKTIKTIGDVTYEESDAEIETKNRASQDIRYVPGMTATAFNLQVQGGTDPDDEDSVDGYAILSEMKEKHLTKPVTFTSPSGFTRTKNMICTAFKPSEPVDGLSVADATLKVSALDPSIAPSPDVGT